MLESYKIGVPPASAIEVDDDAAAWGEVLSSAVKAVTEYEEFNIYCDYFYTFCKKSPYHTRRGYEQGFVAKKKPYKSKPGSYYPACFPELLARHLDTERDRPFWLALRFGEKAKVKCLDFDNKQNIIGYYKRDGHIRPVAHLPLAHFKLMKRLYDTFPNHVWCVSSATLGLHVWEKLTFAQDAGTVERRNRPKLNKIGLGDMEVYPSPKLSNQALRRPFGLDYYTISEDRLLEFWADQTTFFDTASTAPPFAAIVRHLLDLEAREWYRCDKYGGLKPTKSSPFVSKKQLNRNRLGAEVTEILAWLKNGFPDNDQTIINMASEPNARTVPAPVLDTGAGHSGVSPSVFRPTSRLSTSSRPVWSWAHVTELARNGVTEEHRLFEYLLLLARPLVWRDYYHLEVAERLRLAEEDLMYWVQHRNNGRVTRVELGKMADIRHEVRRQVRVAHDSATDSLQQFYATMRARDTSHPDRVERLSDIIRGRKTTSPLPVCCRRINTEPDDTPLPSAIIEILLRLVREHKMRRRDGEFPFIRFARRFLNAIWQDDGAAEIHRDHLFALCDTKNPNQLVAYKKLLAESGLISDQWEGHVRPGVSSAVYQMTPTTFAAFQTHHGTQKTHRRVAGSFTATANTEAKLAMVDWSW